MFSFNAYEPSPLLQPFVEKYHFVRLRAHGWVQNLVPSNKQNIGFVLHGSMRSASFDAGAEISKSYVMGQITSPVTATYFHEPEVFAIMFKPTGMYQLFGIPMDAFKDRGIDFELIAGAEGRSLVEKMQEPVSQFQRIAWVESFLLRQLHKMKDTLAERISYACDRMLLCPGTLYMNKLVAEVNMSERNFERHFIGKVGVTPKTFAGIARMTKAMQMIESFQKYSWKNIAYTLGYADQSHFIHEFKRFSGRTPTEYYRSTTDFEHFLYGEKNI